jgi:hypothetical protein
LIKSASAMTVHKREFAHHNRKLNPNITLIIGAML